MRRNKKFKAFFFLFLILSSNAYAGRYGGSLVLATVSDPKTFNAITAADANSTAVISLLFEGLTRVDPETLKVVPLLAQSWDVSPDGLSWVFHLRHDVRWSDGVRFSAEDVVFTFNDLIFNPDIPSSSKDVLTLQGKPIRFIKEDQYTVRCILPVRFAPFLRAMTQPILPAHALRQAVFQKKFAFFWGIDTPVNQVVGTGPFILKAYYPGERLVFNRNPYYWKKTIQGDRLPYLDRITYLIIPDAQAQLLKFMDGELDATAVSGSDYPLLKPLERSRNFHIFSVGANENSSFITFNQHLGRNLKTGKNYIDPVKLSWFTNLNFRKAIAHSIDKEQIIDILNNGFGQAQIGPMSPGSGYFYNPHVLTYDYNIEKARHILKEAGFIEHDNYHYLEDPQGHRVEFNFYISNASHSGGSQLAAIICADLARLGMRVNLVSLEFNSLVNKLMSSHDWDMVMIGLTGDTEPHFGQNVWRSSAGLHLWYPHEPHPATLWEKRLDAIFDQGAQELDEGRRKRLYDEFQFIVADKLPVIYTVLGVDMYAVRNKFGNLKPTVHGGAFPNIEEIYIK